MANTQQFSDPAAIGKSLEQGLGMSAADLRRGLSGLSHPNIYGSGNESGVFPHGSGAGKSGALLISAGGGMTTNMAPGCFASDKGSGNVYHGMAYGGVADTHDQSNAANPRYDLVVVRTKDPSVDSGVTESARRFILKGDPAAAPVRPTAKMEAGDVLLATVLVRAGATSIVASDITDERRFIVARGGIMIRFTGDTRLGSYEGQFAYNLTTKDLEVWNGSRWDAVATSSVWSTYTPTIRSSAGDLGLGSGSRRVGKYQLTGKRLDFNLFFKYGDPPWNGGYGPVYTYLPSGMYGGRDNQWVNCHLWSNSSAFNGDFPGQALIVARDNRIQPFFARKNTDGNTDPFVISNPASTPGSGVPSLYAPKGYAEGGEITISGSIEVELA